MVNYANKRKIDRSVWLLSEARKREMTASDKNHSKTTKMGSNALMPSKKHQNMAFFAYALFLGLLFIACSGRMVLDAVHGQLSVFKVDNVLYITDFMHLYRDGKIACSPQKGEMYNPAVQQEWLNRIISPEQCDNPMLTQGPPLMFLVMIPFVAFPIDTAHVLWGAFSMTLGILGLVLLLRDFTKCGKKTYILILVGTMGSYPALATLNTGQTSWFILGMTSLFWWAWMRNRDVVAGIFLGLCMVKFQYLVFWLVPCLAQKRFKIVLTTVVFVVLLLLAVGVFLGWGNLTDYPKALYLTEATTYVAAERMISIRGLASLFLPQSFVLPLSICLSVGSLTALFWFWLKEVDRKSDPQVRLAIAITIFTALLTTAHSFSIDCIILSVAAVLTLPLWDFEQVLRDGPRSLQVYYLLFFLYPILTWIATMVFALFKSLESLTYLALNLVFFICAVKLYIRLKKGQLKFGEKEATSV
jgi:hypothetical protein